ncbi:MAG: hypothetical protein EAZ07_10480 [Cytophagales bacterium]|nr:MAG: hypothetical protein EAZ07_10480 [Cytophagales bacterium]
MSLQIRIEDNKLQIIHNESFRLKGLLPYFENKTYHFSIVNSSESNGIHQIDFLCKETSKYLSIQVKECLQADSLIFSISPNHHQGISGEESLGLLIEEIPHFEIGIGFYKYGPVKAWTYPYKIQKIEDLKPNDNQFLYWKYSDNLYAAMIPLLGKGYVTQLGNCKGKYWGVKAKALVNDFDAQEIPLLAVSFHQNPYKLFTNSYEAGLSHLGKESALRKNKTFPVLFEKLMWCTWNSFMHQVEEKLIFEALERFQSKGISLPVLLIDDGWSDVTVYGTGRLKSFEADKAKFPNGLSHMLKLVKEKYGVQHVGLWHTLNAYWAGIDMESDLGKQFSRNLIAYKDSIPWGKGTEETFYCPTPESDLGAEFYKAWYKILQEAGVSFLKIDNQLIANRICSQQIPFSFGAEQLQKNIQTAVKAHFNSNVINCMGMTIDAIYNYDGLAVARSSEDFFPNNDSFNIQAGNAAVHVTCNVYNAIWWSQMVFPDYDMFQTHHPQAEYHAIARMLSAGPVYITDLPNCQNFEIIKQLTYQDGQIIRVDQPALPTEDCLFSIEEEVPLKVFSKSNQVGLIGVFNTIDKEFLYGTLSPSDVNGFCESEYLIYDYRHQSIEKLATKQKMEFTLSRLEANVYFIYPFHSQLVPIGLMNKYNAPKTIVSHEIFTDYAIVSVFEKGLLALFMPNKPSKILDSSSEEVSYEYDNYLVKINLRETIIWVYF